MREIFRILCKQIEAGLIMQYRNAENVHKVSGFPDLITMNCFCDVSPEVAAQQRRESCIIGRKG